MRIGYIVSMRVPNEKAHGLQTVKMCESLTKIGHKVALIHSSRRQDNPALRGVDPYEYYSVNDRFDIVKLPFIDLIPLLRFLPVHVLRPGFIVSNIVFGMSVLMHAMRHKYDLFVTREWIVAWWLAKFGYHVIVEIHQAKTVSLSKRAVFSVSRLARNQNLVKIAVISKQLQKEFLLLGVEEDKLIVVPDAVNLKGYRDGVQKKTNCLLADLPSDKPIVMYTGHLFPNKGVDVLARAAKYLQDCSIVFVGGVDSDRERLKNFVSTEKLYNVTFIKHVPPAQVPAYQKAASILILPQTGLESQSPLKLYEYMAAKRPIVASDLEPIREVLTNRVNAILTPPGDAEALAAGVRELLKDNNLSLTVANNAFNAVKDWSWEKRAKDLVYAFEQPSHE